MDVSVENFEKKPITVEPLVEKDEREFLLPASSINNSIISDEKTSSQCSECKTNPCMLQYDDRKSSIVHLNGGFCPNVAIDNTCASVKKADDFRHKLIGMSSAESTILEANQSREERSVTTASSETNRVNSSSIQNGISKLENNGYLIYTGAENLKDVSITIASNETNCVNNFISTEAENDDHVSIFTASSETNCVNSATSRNVTSKFENNGTSIFIEEESVHQVSITTASSDADCVNGDNNYSTSIITGTENISKVPNTCSEMKNGSKIDTDTSKELQERTECVNSAIIQDVTSEFENNGTSEFTQTENDNKVSITFSDMSNDSMIDTDIVNELQPTCPKETEHLSECKDIIPTKVINNEIIVAETERKQILPIITEIDKFFDAVYQTNRDMEKKSCILQQKQNLIDEVISYIHAVQSIIRLSAYRNEFTKIIPKDSIVIHANKPFYEAGEHILEELGIYKIQLQGDFKVWEEHRKEILEISDLMLNDFEECKDEMSSRVLMHEISTKMCGILRKMETVTSKREDRNEKCIDLMDSVDTYIRYSSAFIVGDRTLTYI